MLNIVNSANKGSHALWIVTWNVVMNSNKCCSLRIADEKVFKVRRIKQSKHNLHDGFYFQIALYNM